MIYLVADIHGYIRLEWLTRELTDVALTGNDYLVILGDAGIVWSTTENLEVEAYYNQLPCKTLFIDGNHENFDLLYKMPIIDLFGAKVHKISDKIFHLMRGEVYTIENKTIFAFGGGFSLKRLTNSSSVFVWNEEMPNQKEYQNGKMNSKKNNIDFVLTHVAPQSIATKNGINIAPEERKLNEYLDELKKTIVYKRWFFGHYHKDFDDGNCSCLYQRIVKIGE